MGLQYKIVYKKGTNNRVADALSRRSGDNLEILALSVVQPLWINEILHSYDSDTYAQAVLQQLAVDPKSHKFFTLHNGLLKIKNCIWIGQDSDLQLKIVEDFHSSPVGGHSGFPVTCKRILSLFRWTGLKAMVQQYVSTWQVCQQSKLERVQYPGLLKTLSVPDEAWYTVSMDFIHGLPTSGRYNCILVIIDSFSKFAHFVPVRHPFTASKIADIFMDNIYRLHGLPVAVVSDRDPVFTSKFWQGIFARLDTKLNMSSSYHPQSDGQTERLNQTVECYLRCFVQAHPSRWAKWLSLCEY